MRARYHLASAVLACALSLAGCTATVSFGKQHAKPTLIARSGRSETGNSFVERSIDKEGVYRLPLVRRTVTESLSRRGSSNGGGAERVDLGLLVAINGRPFRYTFQITSDSIMAYNVLDDQDAWDPVLDHKAKRNGPTITSVYDMECDQWAVESFKVGQSELKGTSLLYSQPLGQYDGASLAGDVGFGLPGSSTFGSASSSSFLRDVYKQNAWAKPVYSLSFGSAGDTGPDTLTLGEAAHKTVWSPSMDNDRWTLLIDINGHKGKADLSTNEHWISCPPEVATEIITTAGLVPRTDGEGTILAEPFDCNMAVPDLRLTLEGVQLLFTSVSSLIPTSSGQCTWFVRGVEQGVYPTPYSLGLVAFTEFNTAFDFTPGAPKIGFAPVK